MMKKMMKPGGIDRDSNIELLRIVAMFMILLLHANFASFNAPDDCSLMSFGRCVANGFTVTAVNVFVLITGYFGTRFSVNKVMALVYQVIFCVVPITLLLIALGKATPQGANFAIHRYWFINAYIGLLVAAPVLNAAVENLTRRQLLAFLVSFYLLNLGDIIFGLAGVEVSGGYAVVWFAFLYVLGRYVRLYEPRLTTAQLLLVMVASCLCKAMLVMKCPNANNYVEPFVLIESVCMLLIFSRFNFKSRWVNVVAASSAMVYLVNLHPAFWGLFKAYVRSLYDSAGNVCLFLIELLLFCAALFVAAILYDQMRLVTWRPIAALLKKLAARRAR